MANDVILKCAIAAMWGAWLAYWAVAARGTKKIRWRESSVSQSLHIVPLGLAGLLVGVSDWPLGFLNARIFPYSFSVSAAGVAVLALALGFSVWARIHLKGNWSATVTVKEGHELIRSGPYKYVRHPIYTGLIFGIFGMAIWAGEWRGIFAVLLTILAFTYKSRTEERELVKNFPEYEDYRRKTAALIPFIF